MLQRQCSYEYKIAQVDNCIRDDIYQLQVRSRRPLTEIWKGISFEERDRMSVPEQAWKVHVYPFCDYAVDYKGKCTRLDLDAIKRRGELTAWYKRRGLLIPPKSACVFCPFQSDSAWYDQKVNEPDDFLAAVAVDKAIRNSTAKGILQPAYLHESCKPLEEINFTPGDPDLWHGECLDACHT